MPAYLITDDERRRDLRREGKQLRRRAVKPDQPSRPRVIIERTGRPSRTLTIREGLFSVALSVIWLLLLSILLLEASGPGRESVVFESSVASGALFGIGLLAMALVLVDLASYKPRIFVLAERSPAELFDELAQYSGDFDPILRELADSPPERWDEVRGQQMSLMSAAHQFLRLDGLRARIALRVVNRLACLVGSLALVAYALSALSEGQVVARATASAGLADHLYFVVAGFFTIGYGDLHPYHGIYGYGMFMLSVLTEVAILYFALSEVIASQTQFKADLRSAAESYIIVHSALVKA